MDKDTIKKIIRDKAPEIKTKFKADVVGIFGSYARGEQHSGSDVDVLVRFDKGATLLDLVGLSDYLEELLCVPVDVVSEKALHPMMRDDVMNELVVV
ncbi:nucleotidyltransferase family protein [uncultured Methanolobus sp.]|uniref:nucleotidyltransferase family protein n=1 Tax=uncultured Methanolobus sp. TaxID=218300 RepID=UPI0029C867EB|nr:nucleotidyltransferase family protein [uncultured Methanolobus sp.]